MGEWIITPLRPPRCEICGGMLWWFEPGWVKTCPYCDFLDLDDDPRYDE